MNERNFAQGKPLCLFLGYKLTFPREGKHRYNSHQMVSFGLVSVLCQRMLAIFEILSKVKTTFIKRLHLLEEHSQRWRLLLTLSLGENALIMQAPK